MKCLHLLDTTEFAGTERHLLLLAFYLKGQAVDAIIACRRGSALCKTARNANISIRDVLSGNPAITFPALLRTVKEEKPDLLHTHNGRTTLAAAMVQSVTGIPLVATQHFIDPQFTTYRGVKRFVANAAHAWVNKRVTRFIGVSAAVKRAMMDREGIPSSKIDVVWNGIDSLTTPCSGHVAEIQASLRIEAGAPLVVTAARLVPEKGLDALIRSFAIVRSVLPLAVLLIVGEGPLKMPLQALTAQLGLCDSVRFTGFRDNATDYIACGDLFVLASPAEPFGLVLLESMALGKPVVAIGCGGPLEIVVDGVTGQLVQPNDVPALAHAIISVLNDPNRAVQGKAGRSRFEGCFTAKQMACATRRVYSLALGKGV